MNQSIRRVLLSRIFLPLTVAAALAACGGSNDLASAQPAPEPPAAGASGPVGAASAPAGSASGPAAAASAPTIAITARGVAAGPIATLVVAASGGSVTSSDGRLTLDVPAGALPATTRLSIQAIGNEAPGGRGMGYRLLPEGLAFAAPVKLTFHYDDADLRGSEPLALRVAYQDDLRRWNVIRQRTLDEAARTVSVETTHFSDWSKLASWQLSPANTVIGPGLAVDFTVIACVTKGTGTDELAELVYTCVPEPEYFLVETWLANGIDGGTLADGQIATASPGTARYVAPAVAPPTPKNPVSVSARAKDKSGRTTLLVASVFVGAFPSLAGTIISTQITTLGTVTTTHATTAWVVFKHDVATNLYFANSGVVVSRIDRVDAAGCEMHVAWSGPINAPNPLTGQQDGVIAIHDDDGNYTADALTMAAHSGTTNCTSDGKVEAIVAQMAGALWFPAPPRIAVTLGRPGAVVLQRKSDWVFEEKLVWSPGVGSETTVQWRLEPDRAP